MVIRMKLKLGVEALLQPCADFFEGISCSICRNLVLISEL